MSFFRKKAAVEVPPVDNDSQRRELLGSRGPSRPSPSPSPYPSEDAYNARPPPPPSYRSGYSNNSDYSSAQPSPGNRYGGAKARSAVGDPYARGGDADADRAQLFSGYQADKTRNGPGNRFNDRNASSSNDPMGSQTQADEEDDEEVIRETRAVRGATYASAQNALRIANEARETGTRTMEMLSTQAEKLANTQQHMGRGENSVGKANAHVDEMQQLNKSIFNVGGYIGMKKAKLKEEMNAESRSKALNRNHAKAMLAVRDTQNRIGNTFGSLGNSNDYDDEYDEEKDQQRRIQQSRYFTEGDEEGERTERELGKTLHQLGGVVGDLKTLAEGMGREVDHSIRQIEGVSNQVGTLDQNVKTSTRKLDRLGR